MASVTTFMDTIMLVGLKTSVDRACMSFSACSSCDPQRTSEL